MQSSVRRELFRLTFSVRLRMQFSVRRELRSTSPFWLSIYVGETMFQPPPSLSLTTFIGIRMGLSQLDTLKTCWPHSDLCHLYLLDLCRGNWQADMEEDDGEWARCLAQTRRLQRVRNDHVEGCGLERDWECVSTKYSGR
jgi:hypothetical protein